MSEKKKSTMEELSKIDDKSEKSISDINSSIGIDLGEYLPGATITLYEPNKAIFKMWKNRRLGFLALFLVLAIAIVTVFAIIMVNDLFVEGLLGVIGGGMWLVELIVALVMNVKCDSEQKAKSSLNLRNLELSIDKEHDVLIENRKMNPLVFLLMLLAVIGSVVTVVTLFFNSQNTLYYWLAWIVGFAGVALPDISLFTLLPYNYAGYILEKDSSKIVYDGESWSKE